MQKHCRKKVIFHRGCDIVRGKGLQSKRYCCKSEIRYTKIKKLFPDIFTIIFYFRKFLIEITGTKEKYGHME